MVRFFLYIGVFFFILLKGIVNLYSLYFLVLFIYYRVNSFFYNKSYLYSDGI